MANGRRSSARAANIASAAKAAIPAAMVNRSGKSDDHSVGGTPRARVRPAGVKPPAHWTADSGPPAPQAVPHVPQSPKGDMPDPVRYGDWELKGIAVDF